MSISAHLTLLHGQVGNISIVLNRPEIGLANGVTIIPRRDRGSH
jgi:hypothetical protein